MRRAIAALLALSVALAAPASARPARHHAPAHPRVVHAQAAPAAPAGPTHAVIMDGESGSILYCVNCDEPMPPASMSKMMTVLVVAEALNAHHIALNTRYHVSENAWRHGAQSDGSHMFLELNSDVSVGDLLQGVIVVSANDACIALAEGLAGSEEAFVALMNRRAQELGLRSAHFANVTGLPDPNHVISAADLARLARIAIQTHPELYRYYAERTFTYNNHTQENRNPLLGAFPGADGIKTGHTDDSGYGMIGSAVQNGVRRIIVFNGMHSMAERRSEALEMMHSAFEQYALKHLARAGAQMGEAQVYLGSQATVPLVTPRDITLGGTQAMLAGLSAHIVYQGPLRAPIRQGQEVARLVVEGPGFRTQEFPLTAGRAIGGANWFVEAWEGLRRTLFHAS